MKLYCDNNATINIAHNLVQYDRTKQVEVDHHFIKEKLEARLICMPYVPTEEQLADVLTKRLHKGMLNCLINKLEIIDFFFFLIGKQVGDNKYLWTSLRGCIEDFRSLWISFILL